MFGDIVSLEHIMHAHGLLIFPAPIDSGLPLETELEIQKKVNCIAGALQSKTNTLGAYNYVNSRR